MPREHARARSPANTSRRRARLRQTALIAAAALLLAGEPRLARAAEPVADRGGAQLSAELVLRALSLLGVHYRFGGNSPESGLDCSGLVRYVFREAAGLALPRRSEEISRVGQHVNHEELREGDLVFFNTLRRAFSHVGIYIGEGRFVHAPSSGGQVSVEEIDRRYWQHRFNGGRRLLALEEAAREEVPRPGHPTAQDFPAPASAPPALRLPDPAGAPPALGLPDPAGAALYQN